jgi:hypothetical protein
MNEQQAKHTPAPWLLAGDDKTFVYALNEQGYNRFSAHVQPGHVGPMVWTSTQEIAANARLIAASPEILEALKAVHLDAVHLGANEFAISRATVDKVTAAIAKATGAAA